jgi:hypothetical protein
LKCRALWDACTAATRASKADSLLGYQIDANRFSLSGFRVDTNFEVDGLIPSDFVALSQCRDVKENINAAVIRFNEAEAFFVVPHLNFAGWHTVPQFL